MKARSILTSALWRSCFRLSLLAERQMKKKGGGAIIHNASVGGLFGFPCTAT